MFQKSSAGHFDAALIEAERQVHDLLPEANKVPSEALSRSLLKLAKQASIGAACKLRIVLDPEVSLAAGESGKEIPMLLDMLAVVERLADSTALPEDR